jgi:hypothetical protein
LKLLRPYQRRQITAIRYEHFAYRRSKNPTFGEVSWRAFLAQLRKAKCQTKLLPNLNKFEVHIFNEAMNHWPNEAVSHIKAAFHHHDSSTGINVIVKKVDRAFPKEYGFSSEYDVDNLNLPRL